MRIKRDPANELINVTRTGSLNFAGAASTTMSNLTVNGLGTALYSDNTFATTNGLATVNGVNTLVTIGTDAAGDRITNVFTVNLANSSKLVYDANGNLVSDGVRSLVYDDLNELVQVTMTNTWRTVYDYDGEGRHHDRREYAWQGGNWVAVNTCYYVYSGFNVVQEVNTALSQGTISYTYGLQLLERDSNLTNQPTGFYQLDGNGNVVMMYDRSGNILAKYLYDPYGNLLAQQGPLASLNHYRFSGKEFNPHTSLYYYGYRFYDPNLQRWLNQDPIGENGGINLYEAIGNDPLNEVDPFGLNWGQGVVNSFGDWELNTYNSASSAIGNFLNNAFLKTTVQTDPNMYYAGTGNVTPITDANGNDITSSLLAQVAMMPLMAAAMGPEREGADLLAGAKCEKLLGPGTSFASKIESQLAKRGWTKGLVDSTIENPVRTVATQDTRFLPNSGRMNDPATAYYSDRGRYVVRNNRTGDIVQVSDRTDPGWKAPWDN